jgi:carbon monoxide dehydrogenase subunit G
MQLTKTQDIEAPRDAVFAALTDIDSWERTALRRGVDVQRLGQNARATLGMAWRAVYPFRGKRREVTVHITRLDPGQTVGALAEGAALSGEARIDLTALSPRRTRAVLTVQVTARTLGARLFLQSLRLAPGRVRQRFDRRVAEFAAELEARLNAPPRG